MDLSINTSFHRVNLDDKAKAGEPSLVRLMVAVDSNDLLVRSYLMDGALSSVGAGRIVVVDFVLVLVQESQPPRRVAVIPCLDKSDWISLRVEVDGLGVD